MKKFKLSEPLILTVSVRKRFFCYTVGLLVIHALMYFFYRPYIYDNHLFDFHIADTFPDFIAVPAAVFFGLSYMKKVKDTPFGIVFATTLAFVIFEFIFSFTCDYYDMIAAVVSAVPTYFILNNIFRSLGASV